MHWVLNAGLCVLSGVVGGLLAVGFCFWLAGAGDPWVGFAGSIISGALTLVAAAAAFGLTRRQVDMQADELKGFKEEHQQRANTLRAMSLEAVRHVASTAEIAKDALNNRHVIRIPANEFPSVGKVSNIINVGDVWRLDRETALKTIEAEVSSEYFNSLKWAIYIDGTIEVDDLIERLQGLISACDAASNAIRDEIKAAR